MGLKRFIKNSIAVFLCLVLLLGTVFTGCAQNTGTKKPVIRLIEGDWTSHIIGTEIAAQIIEKQLGYTVQKIQMSVTAGWAAIGRGDADLCVEAWLPARQPELQPFLDNGTLEIGGEIYPGDSGWYVPRYVIEGDPSRGIKPIAPDLKSILDLQTVEKGGKGYWKIFENPEKPGLGELVGGSPGWYDDAYDRMRIKGYDLPLWRSNQSESVMMARMIAADKKGQPLLMFLWEPHWLFAVVDLVKLEEPNPWYEGAFDDESKGYKAAYPPTSIHTVVSSKLKDTAPDVYNMIKDMVLGLEDANALQLRVDVDKEEVKAVASDWISKNQARIDKWLGK
jgi:glycine betaine/proline transport system substrate-binding protein